MFALKQGATAKQIKVVLDGYKVAHEAEFGKSRFWDIMIGKICLPNLKKEMA